MSSGVGQLQGGGQVVLVSRSIENATSLVISICFQGYVYSFSMLLILCLSWRGGVGLDVTKFELDV